MTFHWSPILLSWEWTICVDNELVLWLISGKHLPFCKLQPSFPETLKGIFIAVQNIPLNIQKRNEQSINEGSWLFKYALEHAEREWTFYEKKVRRAFLRFLWKNFLQNFGFQDSSMTSWGSTGGVTVLGRMLQCISNTKKIWKTVLCRAYLHKFFQK
jgi:hypothetical protein